MSKKDDRLDEILEKIEELTQMIIDDLIEPQMDFSQEIPGDAIQAFRITEQVYNELEKELGKGWVDKIGVA